VFRTMRGRVGYLYHDIHVREHGHDTSAAFAETDNVNMFNFGVDNVSLDRQRQQARFRSRRRCCCSGSG